MATSLDTRFHGYAPKNRCPDPKEDSTLYSYTNNVGQFLLASLCCGESERPQSLGVPSKELIVETDEANRKNYTPTRSNSCLNSWSHYFSEYDFEAHLVDFGMPMACLNHTPTCITGSIGYIDLEFADVRDKPLITPSGNT
ncbi:hypothetical protein Syun_025643 [Stephania yunnanensis]|uniref:Uncharacterized protein n=1 Tax=Stephania yunnanensis TaxID=152371 RepID=A0AAP0EXK7_9MAGN